MQTILVTGASGFLGSAIVRMLIDRGDKVHAIYRQKNPKIEKMVSKIFLGDIGNIDLVKQAAQGCDAVIHTAAKAGMWGKYKDYYHSNVQGTENIVQACLQSGIPKLVYTSSPSVAYGIEGTEGGDESLPYPSRYDSFYSATKAQAERLVLASNSSAMATCALRPHLIWGPEDNHLVPRIIAKAKQGRLRIVGNGKNLIDSIYVDNAAYAHLLALDRLVYGKAPSGKVYFLSQDKPVPAKELINQILHAAGISPIQKHIPARVAFLAGLFCETAYSLFSISAEPPMTRFLAHQLSTPHWFNIQAAKNDLGYSPIISIEEGLNRLEAWFKANSVPGNILRTGII